MNIYIDIIITSAVFLTGTAILFVWLLKTNIATTALKNIPPRRTSIQPYVPFVIFFAWLSTSALISLLAKDTEQLETLNMYILRTLISLFFSIVIILAAKMTFARGLKGFGLNPKTLPKDLGVSFANLLAVFPIVIAGLAVVILTGKLIFGPDFQFDSHQSLTTIRLCDSPLKLTIMLLMIIVITPTFEELLFRGLIQSTIASYLPSKWLSILIASVVFSMLHQPTHWPAIFALSVCLGYSYEKSNSLFRPILIHAIFNAVNTACALSI